MTREPTNPPSLPSPTERPSPHELPFVNGSNGSPAPLEVPRLGPGPADPLDFVLDKFAQTLTALTTYSWLLKSDLDRPPDVQRRLLQHVNELLHEMVEWELWFRRYLLYAP